ncbi:MAG TPA: hypothetical protein VD928_01990 [Candidatus Paceibacterota bacterium]|nr:hypothetical protein [Candidatus Paceibacterota bacterium]
MSKIEEQVMASVAVIHTTRRMLSKTALKVYVLAISFWGIVALVSVGSVTQNFTNVAQHGVGDIVLFLISAVLSTTILVQLVLIAAVGSLASLFIDVVRSTRRTFLA